MPAEIDIQRTEGLNVSDTETQDPGEIRPETDPTAFAKLQASVRWMRIGLIITSIIAFASAGILVMAVLTVFGSAMMPGSPDKISGEEIADVKKDIQEAYGQRLGRLEVRAVKTEFDGDDAPFPFSMMGSEDSESLYVEYSLQGSSVPIANVIMWGGDPVSSGMLPTKGSLTERMTQEQFERLLAAYATQTKSPLGTVARYGSIFDEGGSSSQTITIGEGTYPVKELWSAIEGRVVKGDSVKVEEEETSDREAFIFREDPATKQFTFLGTEPAESIYGD